MNIRFQLRQISALPVTALPQKAFDIFLKKRINAKLRANDEAQTTFLKKKIPTPLLSYFTAPAEEFLKPHETILTRLSELYCNHQFDLLGSGWVQIFHGMKCNGVEGFVYESGVVNTEKDWLLKRINSANAEYSQQIWDFIPESYRPIDWQIDFKSGWRWSEKTWSRDIHYGDKLGADIKVPCELGQMHHLVTLALAAILFKSDSAKFERLKNEFRNQVLDFIAQNPPRYGVQWLTTMDVAIRAANWLTAYDLFKSAGAKFDEEFENIFKSSIYGHGVHIVNNLEWSSGLRANHYIGNIAGLLFIAAYLPSTAEIDDWLAFGVSELEFEFLRQFYPDGGNFEASTSYHRLCLERVLWSCGIVLALSEEKRNILQSSRMLFFKNRGKVQTNAFKNPEIFSEFFFTRLQKAIEFTVAITKPNGDIPQIGDNDNNRFLKFTPIFKNPEAEFPEEQYNKHLHLAGAFIGFSNEIFGNKFGEFALDKEIMRGLFKQKSIGFKSSILLSGSVSFPDFGLYIFKNDTYYCAVRCGAIGQHGKGGHAHNDQLSFELNVAGEDVIVDPGTYIYSGLPSRRNEFRSTAMHNTLFLKDIEQNEIPTGGIDSLFWMMRERTKAKGILEDGVFTGQHFGYSEVHMRELVFNKNNILATDILDCSNKRYLAFHFAPEISIGIEAANIVTFRTKHIGGRIFINDGKALLKDGL
ncbi:MAG TPA: alginate lyase family protein, partial [Patescibacteria group bacterium]|nr:alginate lyase family protein [Patescibacteria group bacterium]